MLINNNTANNNNVDFTSLLKEDSSPSPSAVMVGHVREQRRPMWTQHEKAVLRLLMREYAGVTEYDPPDIHKHPIKNEMWRLLTSRYNDHPNVRTRDTKQLRKAWENLKYRARKMGETKKSSRRGHYDATPWPLDGVSLSIAKQKAELQSEEYEEDTKPLEDDRKGSLWLTSDNTRKMEETVAGSLDTESSSLIASQSLTDNLFNRVTSEICSDFLSASNRSATVNLQPLVTSLVGGALLPFLSPPSLPNLATEFLANHPFASMFGVQPDVDSISACSKDRHPESPPSSCAPDEGESTMLLPNDNHRHWPPSSSSPLRSDEGVKLKNSLGAKEDFSFKQELMIPSSPTMMEDEGDESTPSYVERRIVDLHCKQDQQRERHLSTLRWLNLQISQAEAQHELKMKILDAQLLFWKTKLSLIQKESS